MTSLTVLGIDSASIIEAGYLRLAKHPNLRLLHGDTENVTYTVREAFEEKIFIWIHDMGWINCCLVDGFLKTGALPSSGTFFIFFLLTFISS